MGSRFLPVVVLAAALAGCAAPTTRQPQVSAQAADAEAIKQGDLAAQALVDQWQRIERVYRTLATQAVALCESDVAGDPGFVAMTRPKGPIGEALHRVYGVGESPTVLFVVKGGPADAAGLRSGDVVRKVNETPVADTESLHAQEDQLDRHALKVYEVERAGETLAVPVTPDAACRYRVYLSGAQVVNAFANGKDVMVTRGMAGFAGTDDELALVLSHEMAHNVMRHIDKRKQNAGAGALGDLLIALLTRGQYYGSAMSAAAASAYSQEFEAEADYVGLYIMASAGFPIDDAPQFWRRMAAMNPASIKGSHSASHPSTAYRMIALENAVQEIHAKQAAGEPLRPNLKDGQVAPATAR